MLFSHAVDNDPDAISNLISEIEALEARSPRSPVDMLDGAASLAHMPPISPHLTRNNLLIFYT